VTWVKVPLRKNKKQKVSGPQSLAKGQDRDIGVEKVVLGPVITSTGGGTRTGKESKLISVGVERQHDWRHELNTGHNALRGSIHDLSGWAADTNLSV